MASREITAVGKKLAEYVQDLYKSGEKLWTKEMFHEVEEALTEEPLPHDIMIRSMNGVRRRKQVPQFVNMRHLTIATSFKIYQQMVYDAEEEHLESDPEDMLGHTAHPNPDNNISDDKALVTRSLTLVGYERPSSTIERPQMTSAWNEARRNWLHSSVCQELTAILAKDASISNAIRKIVCFGLGSLEGRSDHSSLNDLAPYDGLPRRRAMTQHAAVLTIAEVLGQRLGIDPLPILAQDPMYSSLAKQLLTDEGIMIVGGCGSLAFTHVDENTLVFSCYPDIPVKQVVADIAKPAAMIWNQVKPARDEPALRESKVFNGEEVIVSPWLTDEDSARTRQLVKDYIDIGFPAEPERFGDLKIYCRKEQ